MRKRDGYGQPPSLDLKLHHKQWELITTAATEVLFGGAAGGGKSHAIRVSLILWCIEIPGLQCYLFRRNYPELVKTHLEGPASFPRLLAPLIASGYCAITGNREIRFWNGSKIFLQNAERDRDVDKFRSYEFHVLAIDELTTFSEYQYRFLRSRVRMAGVELPAKFYGKFPRIIAGSNPGGVGHGFVKSAWISQLEPYEIKQQEASEGGFLRQYIPSRLEDNPSLDDSYRLTLSGLKDPALVRAMLDGDWSIVAGSAFGDVWRHPLHVCTPFPIPIDWQVWRGADDGFSAPAAVVWLTQDPSTKRYYAIDELYRSGMLPEVYASRTLEIDAGIPRISYDGEIDRNKEPLSGLLDSSAFADTGQGVISRGRQMVALGARWEPVEKWPGSRKHRAQNLHKLLAPLPDGLPGLRVFSHCRNLIEILPALPRDSREPESVDTDAEDHIYDALTYGLQWRDMRARRVRLGGT